MANWNDLPFEMKEMVTKEMDFMTRAHLKICSKSDKYLVDSIPVICDSITLEASPRTKGFEDCLIITQNSKTVLWLYVRVDRNYTVYITREAASFRKYQQEIPCSSIEEVRNMVKEMYANILFTRKFYCKVINLNHVNYPEFIDMSKFEFHTKQVKITAKPSQVHEWLTIIAPGFESVIVQKDSDNLENEGIGTIPAITNASKLHIESVTDINDDQLLNFKCTDMKHQGKSNITGEGLNRLTKKAIANDYPIASSFQISVDATAVFQTWADIIEGLYIEITSSSDMQNENDDDRQPRLCVRRGQIKMSHGKRMEVSLRYLFELGYRVSMSISSS